ncbi:MAG: hypothetical protein JWM57_1824 [Phycisphaerales bacterium]|nr:hypothetical protein [Phycisphaerales bacterium]
MRRVFVRFVTTTIDRDSYRRTGLFQAIGDLVDQNELHDYQLEEIRALRRWFGDKLDAPDRFSRSQKSGAAPKAISWFKSTATEHVSQMHVMCRILNEHGIATEMITTTRPGYIVFEDEFQVAAVPFFETTT